jgi:FOG: WD40 repeat
LEGGETSNFRSRCWRRGDNEPERIRVVLLQDGRRLALGSVEGLVEVWDVPRRALWRRLTNSIGLVRAVKFFAEGNRLLTLSVNDHIFDDWDLTTASKVQSWQAPPDIIHYALSPDERRCVIMGYAGDVVLRDLTDKITTKLNLDIRKES